MSLTEGESNCFYFIYFTYSNKLTGNQKATVWITSHAQTTHPTIISSGASMRQVHRRIFRGYKSIRNGECEVKSCGKRSQK